MSSLRGRTIVVTRPREQAGPLVDGITSAGGEALLFPLLEIEAIDDAPEFLSALRRLDGAALAIFISPNAVRHGLAGVRRHGRWPDGVPVAAVGQGTAQALREAGFAAAVVPESGADSEALLACRELSAALLAGRDVVLFKGEGGRDLLASTLAERGATVLPAPCYRRLPPAGNIRLLIDRHCAGRLHALVLSSSEAVRHLGVLLADADPALLRETPAFCPHPRIAEAASAIGCRRICLTGAGDSGILAGLSEYNWPTE